MSEPTWELLGGGGVVGGPVDYVGDWAVGTTYQPGQVVRFAGVDYLAVNPSLGQVPPRTSPLAPGMVCLFDQLLTANQLSIDIPNISQAYSHLRLMALKAGTSTNAEHYMRANGDAGANYDSQVMQGSSASPSTAENFAQTLGIRLGNTGPLGELLVVDIPGYKDPLYKSFHVKNGFKMSNTSGQIFFQEIMGYWRSQAAINRLTLTQISGQSYLAGSRFSLYGLLAAGQAPPVATLAPGGFGTTFPTSPANGEIFTLVDSLTAPTYQWTFRYVASITDAYKWVFIGGAPVIKFDLGTLTTTSTSYVVPTNGSGTVAATAWTADHAGIYQASVKDDANANTGTIMYQGIRFGATDVTVATPYGDAAKYLTRSGIAFGTVATAGGVIQPIIAVGAGTLTIQTRQIAITPVRIS